MCWTMKLVASIFNPSRGAYFVRHTLIKYTKHGYLGCWPSHKQNILQMMWHNWWVKKYSLLDVYALAFDVDTHNAISFVAMIYIYILRFLGYYHLSSYSFIHLKLGRGKRKRVPVFISFFPSKVWDLENGLATTTYSMGPRTLKPRTWVSLPFMWLATIMTWMTYACTGLL